MREKQKGPPVREHRRANQGDGLTTHHQKFNTEREDLQRKEPQKIHKVPENTVKKAVCGRKAG